MSAWLIGFLLLIGGTVSLAPCPLATNFAAVGYLTQSLGSRKRTLIASVLYVTGRMAAYVVIGLLVSGGLAAAPSLSFWLQEELPLYLGPLMMLAGLVILGYVPFFSFRKRLDSERVKMVLDRFGFAGAFVIGFAFALALCPPSAALFFGTAVPLSLEAGENMAWVGISAFGLGTALPVIVLSLLLIFGMEKAATVMNNLPKVQFAVKLVTGWFFIGLGGYWIFTKILFN